MVLRRIELGGIVAARAQRIGLDAQLLRVRFVAVHAGHAVLVHLALQEGAPDVDLFTLLAVGMIIGRHRQRQAMAVLQRCTRFAVLAQGRAAGMAGGADIHAGRVGRAVAHGEFRIARREFPCLVPVALQLRQALVALCPIRGPGLGGPVHMVGALAVAGFAGDVDFAVGGLVGIAGGVVALPQVGRMALGALQRPVLVATGPVQRILVVDLLAGLQMEPALAALILRPRIPGDRQRLIAAAGEGNQVLLQRIETEGVGDLVIGELAVRPVGAHHELVAAREEGGLDAVVAEFRVGEVAEDGLGVRLLHREVMMGSRPGLEFRLVAGLADGGADVGGRGGHWRGRNRRCRHRGRRRWRLGRQGIETQAAGHDQQCDDCSKQVLALRFLIDDGRRRGRGGRSYLVPGFPGHSLWPGSGSNRDSANTSTALPSRRRGKSFSARIGGQPQQGKASILAKVETTAG